MEHVQFTKEDLQRIMAMDAKMTSIDERMKEMVDVLKDLSNNISSLTQKHIDLVHRVIVLEDWRLEHDSKMVNAKSWWTGIWAKVIGSGLLAVLVFVGGILADHIK